MKNKFTNPIYRELLKLKLINNKNLINIFPRTRDKRILVFKDCKTNIILLEKCVTSLDYYSNDKYESSKKGNFRRILNSSPGLEDDKRRALKFNRFCKNKDVLDFGCGWGNFLTRLKSAKSLNGVELRTECVKEINKNKKFINVKKNINDFNKKFDVVTLFHVLEHIPYQVKTLKLINKKIKKNGKIIVEVPHANDFLLELDELKEFKNFSFWSEHLILHTYLSLKKVLRQAGFKNIKVSYYQRYKFDNHLGWFIKRKPGGHKFFKNLISDELNLSYAKNLTDLKKTDTLIAEAFK